MLTFGLSIMSCSQQPQDSCGFVQNSHGERISWKRSLPVRLHLHESVKEDYRGAFRAAADKWNDRAGKKIIEIPEETVAGPPTASRDGANVIYFSSTWEEGKETEQGRTSVYWVGDQIREADIKINSQNFKYYWQKTPEKPAVNIEALAVHEMGHVLGLKHKDGNETVMHTHLANNTDRTHIGEADMSSLKCEY